MADTVPDRFEIDIDRDGVRRYLRLSGLVAILPWFLFFGGFLGIVAGVERLEQIPDPTVRESVTLIVSRFGIGLAIGALLGLVLYGLLVHRGSRHAASASTLRVDGMFLHVIQGAVVREDRKIHFNRISDYSVIDGPLMRMCGIRALGITCATTRPNGRIIIPGVIDAERIRDQLCTIDREREDRVG